MAIPHAENNELLLIDLWLVLKSRRGVVFAVFLAAILSAGAASFVTPPVFESRAVLEVGKVEGFDASTPRHMVEDPTVVLQRLREEHGFEDGRLPKKLPYLDSVGHPRNSGQNMVALTARGRAPAETQAFLAEVIRPILERHYELYKQVRSAKEAQIDELEREIKALQAQADALARVVKNVDPGQTAVVTLERGNLLSALATLRTQRTNLALSLTGVGTYPTRLIQEPTLAVGPIRPNPPLYVLLGAALGLVLGIAVALVVEFLGRAREISRVRESRTAEHMTN